MIDEKKIMLERKYI